GPFASPFGPFQARFRTPVGVNKIQITDYQRFQKATKIAYLRREARSLQISQTERPKMNK
ncbi:hypothetical protein, partial [Segatella buccae]|uniref:hypothetical protein n=1 Tax=Segatella buccae TaxID=28126 RepID=UPI003FD8518F